MIVDDIMDLNHWDPYYKSEIASLCDAAIVECNILGVPAICSSNEYEFVEYIDDAGLRSLVKEYLKTYTRLRFDPPQNSKQIDILTENEKKLRSRIKDYIECSHTFYS